MDTAVAALDLLATEYGSAADKVQDWYYYYYLFLPIFYGDVDSNDVHQTVQTGGLFSLEASPQRLQARGLSISSVKKRLN